MTAKICCTKFVSGVIEDDLEWALSTLESSVLPILSRQGFLRPLVVVKRRRMERVNRERARDAVEALAESMVREARSQDPHDPSLKGDIKALRHMVLVGPRSSAEGMLAHHKKRKRPAEYERLREERDSQRNRDVVDGVQLDIYVRHAGEVSKTSNFEGRPDLPLALRTLRHALKDRLFLGVKIVNYLTLGSDDVGDGTRRETRHALQVYADIPGRGRKRFDDPEDVRARLHALLDAVAGDSSRNHYGAEGVLALKSLGTGVTRDLRWLPRGIPQHRGDETDVSGKATGSSGDVYEAVLYFETETGRDEAIDRIDVGLPGVVGREYIDEGLGTYASRAGEVVIVS